MLDGVPGFVGGDSEGGEAGATVIVPAQREAFVGGVVVVGEGAVALDDLDIMDAGIAHDSGGGLAPGDATTGGHLHVFTVGAFYFHLSPKAHHEWDDN